MGRVVDSAKREAWRRRLRQFERGDETIARFCDREGVSVTSFHRWRQALESRAEANEPASRMGFLPVTITSDATSSSDDSAASNRSSRIEVLLPGGVRLLVPGDDVELVRTVIAALTDVGRGAPAC